MIERRYLKWVAAFMVTMAITCNYALFFGALFRYARAPEHKLNDNVIYDYDEVMDIYWLIEMSEATSHDEHTYAPQIDSIPDRVHYMQTENLPWYNFTMITGTNNRHIGPVTSVRFHWPMKFTSLPENEVYIINLNLSCIFARTDERFLGGELLVYHYQWSSQEYLMRIELSDVTNASLNNDTHMTQLLNSFNQTGWLMFDISDWLATYQNTATKILKLHLNAVHHLTNNTLQENHIRVRRSTDASEWTKNDTHLVTYHRDPRSTTLDADDETAPAGNKSLEIERNGVTYDYTSPPGYLCQRQDYFVLFSTLNWDKIIVAPHGYNAGLCMGICPFPLSDYFNTTPHAIVQSNYNQLYGSSIPPPCCAPVKLKFERFVFRNQKNGHLELRKFLDMAVEDCGCL